jgi:aminobenzoyl-glutamate utilization protein B
MRLILLFFIISLPFAHYGQKMTPPGEEAIRFIDRNSLEFIALSDSIWKYAEPSYNELRSAGLIKEKLKRAGFDVTGVLFNDAPTMFVARYGKEGPVIALHGEYDADPGASNKIVPTREELVKDGYGHGGHHNLLGVGSLAAALAIQDMIKKKKLKCTVVYYGSSAEGKDDLRSRFNFKGISLSLYWHPSPVTAASTGKWDALNETALSFRGSDKESLRLAYEQLRTELDPIAQRSNTAYKFNYQVTDTTLNTRLQCVTQGLCDSMFSQVAGIQRAIAKRSGVKDQFDKIKNIRQYIPNVTAARVVRKNIELLGPITYTEEEQTYVRHLQAAINSQPAGINDTFREFTDISRSRKMYGYASDIGEMSWSHPEVYFTVKTLPFVSMHTWQGTAFSAHSIGHKGMIQASKVLALTIIEYVQNADLQTAIENENSVNRQFFGGR